MESLWNDRWARTAALLLVGGGAVLLALEAPPLGAFVEMIGVRGVALVLSALLLGTVLILFPGWWPLWRARRAGLPNPWIFALVIWGFTTAALQTVLMLVVVPVTCFNVFFLPQFRESGVLTSENWSVLGYVSEYWWMAFPFLQVVGTVWVTRMLARRWRAVDGMLAP